MLKTMCSKTATKSTNGKRAIVRLRADRRRAVALLLLFFTLLSTATAQRCRLFGRVVDENGDAVELANVRIQGSAQGTMTRLDGTYSFYVAPADTMQTLIFSMIGYETRKRTIAPARGDSLRIDVMLPSLGLTMGTATVEGQRIQTGTLQRLEPTELKTAPSTTGNAVEEMIATQAGVSTHNELSSQYNVRGGSFDENCVYLNGVEVYRPMLVRSGQQEGLSIINSAMVESIGFSSGGFEAKYGDRMSSVLDITYKRPQAFEASLSGSMLGGSVYAGWGNKHVSLMTSVRYKTTRYLLGSLDTSGEYDPNFLDYQAYVSWRPNQRWTLDFIGNISDNHYNFEPEDRETNFGTMQEAKSFKVYFDGKEKDYFRTYFGSLSLTRKFSSQTSVGLQFSSFTTQERETYDIRGEYWLNEATTQEQLGVGTYMEHARNSLKARVVRVGLRFRKKMTCKRASTGRMN